MQFRISRALAAAAAALTMMTASVASAQTGSSAICSTQLPPLSSVTFGSGSNSADKSQVVCNDLTGGIFIDMAAIARAGGGNSPPPVIETSPGTYMAQNGAGLQPALAQWNFNYAIVGSFSSTDLFTLMVDYDPGAGTNFKSFALDPVADASASCDADHRLCYQNSENLGFFTDATYTFDPNQTGSYEVEILRNGNLASSINVVVASPEPSTVALSATGLAGLVGFARRRRSNKLAA